jgi:hypothetical protein
MHVWARLRRRSTFPLPRPQFDSPLHESELDLLDLLASNQLIELDIEIILNEYSILRNNAKSIERLSLYEDSRPSGAVPDVQCPRLVELSLRRQYTSGPFSRLRPPPKAPNLEVLKCLNDDVNTSIEDMTTILRNTPKLKRLSLWLPTHYTTSDARIVSGTIDRLPFFESICVLHRPALYKDDSDRLRSFKKSIIGKDSRISVRTVEIPAGSKFKELS